MSAITRNAEILGGQAVFEGTRVPVYSLFDALIAGDTIHQFLQDFPTVRPEDISTVLHFAQASFAAPEISSHAHYIG